MNHRPANREKFASDSLVIEQLDLGATAVGWNTFRARITNLTAGVLSVGLELRAVPGLWLRPAFQNQFVFEIPAGKTQTVEAQYQFRRLSPEAYLRVRIGGVTHTGEGRPWVSPLLFERQYAIGQNNPHAFDPRPSFYLFRTEHFDIFARRGSLAQSRIQFIAAERENGLRQVEEILGLQYADRILLVFYPDSTTKTEETGHIGAGFGGGGAIVEIYNAEIQLDPYHEVAHIVAGDLGDPPALLNEGFATYVSERLGAPALRYLGHPDKTINEAVCALAASGDLIPLAELLRFTEIGSEVSRPPVSYPQAASIVKYLIEVEGVERFREAYRVLVNGDEQARFGQNEQAFARIFGKSLVDLEQAWRRALPCSASH